MIEQDQPPKYINHTSGVPIRIPPYLRLEISRGSPDAQIQLNAIRKDPYVGQRRPEDTLPANTQENVRLRKIAGGVAKELRDQAQRWGAERYTVVVHGSLAKGIVRNPSSPDQSDIDIDLIIDGPKIPSVDRRKLRENLRSEHRETKIDSYVWDMDEIRRTVGEYARYYLRSASYPMINKGGLWQEVLWTGLESQRFLNLHGHVKKKIRHVLPMIIDGRLDQVLNFVNLETEIGTEAYKYLKEIGILDMSGELAELKARKIYTLLRQQDRNPNQPIARVLENIQKQSLW